MDGEVVGVIANQPLHLAGMIDGPAADKITHFIQLCDAFHIPLIFLSDVPGFMTGKASERAGTLRRGLRIAYASAFVTVPTISVVLRKAYGMGAVAMCGHKGGQVLTLVWLSGEFGALPVGGGVSAGHRSAFETAPDQAGKRAALENTTSSSAARSRPPRPSTSTICHSASLVTLIAIQRSSPWHG